MNESRERAACGEAYESAGFVAKSLSFLGRFSSQTPLARAAVAALCCGACSDPPAAPEEPPAGPPSAAPSAPIAPKTQGSPSRLRAEAPVVEAPVVEAPVEAPVVEAPVEDDRIKQAIKIVFDSDHTFIAVSRDDQKKEYLGSEFARMLERKWRWLGYDIHAFAPWMREIGAHSFRSEIPYLVVLTPSGSEQEFAAWLRGQMATPDQERP